MVSNQFVIKPVDSLTHVVRSPAKEFTRINKVSPTFDFINTNEPTLVQGWAVKDNPQVVRRAENSSHRTLIASVPSDIRVLHLIGRSQLISTDKNPGTYIVDDPTVLTRYGKSVRVEVPVERPLVIDKVDIEDLRELDPDELAKDHDAVVIRHGQFGMSGDTYRRMVVFDKNKIVPVAQYRPVVTAVPGAKVRDVVTGSVGTLAEVPVYNSYKDTVEAAVWSGTENKLTDFGDIEIIGGHRQLVNNAIKNGIHVPTVARQWELFSNQSDKRVAWRKSEEYGTPRKPYIYVENGT